MTRNKINSDIRGRIGTAAATHTTHKDTSNMYHFQTFSRFNPSAHSHVFTDGNELFALFGGVNAAIK